MCGRNIRQVQEKELENLKSVFGVQLVDLRSKGGAWKPLDVKISLRFSANSGNNTISMDLFVMCGANYPEIIPDFWLANRNGLSDKAIVNLTRNLKNQMLTNKKQHRILDLVNSIKASLNMYELVAFSNPDVKDNGKILVPEKCLERSIGDILHFIDAGKKIKKGQRLDHAQKKGCTAFIGTDLESGQLMCITEWFIRYADQSLFKEKEIIEDINKQFEKMTELKHKNLVHYVGIQSVKEPGGIRIYLAQDFVLGNSVANITKSLGWCEQNVSMVARGVVEALIYLHRNGVSHNLLCDTAVYMDNCSNIRVTDFTLVPYLQRLTIDGETICKNDDLSLLGTLIESMCQTPSKIMNDFIQKCQDLNDRNNLLAILEELMKHAFLARAFEINPKYDPVEINENLMNQKCPNNANTSSILSNSNSRIENFTLLEKLGEGGFGAVYKVKNNLDEAEWAIKMIRLPQKMSKKMYQSILKEVNCLSKLNQAKNVVRYITSWIGPRCEGLEWENSSQSNSTNTRSDESSCDRVSNKFKSHASSSKSVVFANSKLSISQAGSSSENVSVRHQNGNSNTGDEELQWNDSILRSLYIQMELCKGKTLRKIIDNERLFTDPVRVRRLFKRIVEAVKQMHEIGIMHRDLKPDNILFCEEDQVKIVDFGLATTYHHSKESQLKLSHEIGTPKYDAPELSDLNAQYNQKVDLYSLGIILTEMCLPKFNTDMERHLILTAIRTPSVTIPKVLLDNPDFSQNVKLINWLLQHDPCNRPTIEELLLTEQESETTLELTYNNAPIHQSKVDYVKRKIMNLFRKHGGIEVITPLLMPYSENRTINQNAVQLITHSGNTVGLPHDLRLPFARHVALNGVTSIRRYSIDSVYRKGKVINCNPKQLCECAFDIIAPTSGSLLVDAELLSIAYEIINKVPALRQKKISFRINHTTLLRAILMHFNIPTDQCDALFDMWQQYSQVKISDDQLKLILNDVVKNPESVTILCNLFQTEHQLVGQNTKIMETNIQQLLEGTGPAASLATAAIRELELVVLLAQGFDVSCSFYLQPGLAVCNVPTKAGRILWQMVAEDKDSQIHPKRNPRILATGERYDSFFSEFITDRKICGAGFTFSLDNIMQILSFEVRNNIAWSPISVVVWVAESHPPINEVIAMLNSLWCAEIPSGIVEASTWLKAKKMAKEMGAPHLIILNASGTPTLHSFLGKGILTEGQQLTNAELINAIQRRLKPNEQTLRVINNDLRRQNYTLNRAKNRLEMLLKKTKTQERTKKSRKWDSLVDDDDLSQR